MTPKQEVHLEKLTGGSTETELRHKPMGHLNKSDLKNLLPIDLHTSGENYETCCFAKTTKTPVPRQSENKASQDAKRVCTVVIGPITPSSVDG